MQGLSGLPSIISIVTIAAWLAPTVWTDARAQSVIALQNLNGTTGVDPFGSLLLGPDDRLYGTAADAGSGGEGTVFQLKRNPPGNLKALHNFAGGTSDGDTPLSGLVVDGDGVMYGTTRDGGPANRGVVYSLTPKGAQPDRAGFKRKIIHEFNEVNGAEPFGPLTFGPGGELFGTTMTGGESVGTVFQLTPSGGGATRAKHKILHAFAVDQSKGAVPRSRLVRSDDGKLYGTTVQGGATGGGVAFRLIPPPPDKNKWKLEILHDFGTDTGRIPQGGLIFGPNNKLYGMTLAGGTGCVGGCGTIYELARPQGGGLPWVHRVLHHFGGQANGQDGEGPIGELLLDGAKVLFGTTRIGGTGGGIVFRINPSGSGYTILHRFEGAQGCGPRGALIADANGALYGSTHFCATGFGTVFRMTGAGFTPVAAAVVN